MALALLFALLITGIGALVVLYSIFYLSKEKEQLGSFYTYLLMFMTAMLGVVLSDNMVVLYLFWELTSISSFLLIGYWYKRERSRYGATKSLLITVFGGLAMLGGFILIYLMTDSFSIREAVNQLQLIMASPYFIPAMILILLGAFTKSAQFPFYIWLPDAMEAPTPVSSYLHSATMVKAGIYLVARFSPIFAISEVLVLDHLNRRTCHIILGIIPRRPAIRFKSYLGLFDCKSARYDYADAWCRRSGNS